MRLWLQKLNRMGWQSYTVGEGHLPQPELSLQDQWWKERTNSRELSPTSTSRASLSLCLFCVCARVHTHRHMHTLLSFSLSPLYSLSHTHIINKCVFCCFAFILFCFVLVKELEGQLSGQEHLLVLQRTQVWFPVPTSSGSQPPASLVTEDLMPSSLLRHLPSCGYIDPGTHAYM